LDAFILFTRFQHLPNPRLDSMIATMVFHFD
jgi:hypothetical protein